jgi:hypothetical protein
MYKGVPMLFDQIGVDVGLAHRRNFGWHLGAAWHEQMALLQFLQPRAEIETKQAGQCHGKVGVAVSVYCQLVSGLLTTPLREATI